MSYLPSIRLVVSMVTVPHQSLTRFWCSSQLISSFSVLSHILKVKLTSTLKSGWDTKVGRFVLQTTTPFSLGCNLERGALDLETFIVPCFVTFELLVSWSSATNHWLVLWMTCAFLLSSFAEKSEIVRSCRKLTINKRD